MARCPNCDLIVPTGCNCDVTDENCLAWTGDGSSATPYMLAPDLSADGDQLLTCGTAGLFAEVPLSLANPSAVQAYHTANQSIPNNTMTTVALNAELYDTDSMHSTVTNNSRVTFNTAGTYIVTFVCAWNKNVTGDRVAQVRKNATDILGYESKDSGGADLIVGHSITIIDAFVVTDYVEARVQQTAGAALLLMGESYSPILSAIRVAP